jgi:hypothetical protein
MAIRLKENIIKERMPQCESFSLFICGSTATKIAVYNGYKNENEKSGIIRCI